MAYSEAIDARLRPLVARWRGMEIRKMFGGVGYLLHGNMVCGVYQEFLILRLGEEQAAAALTEPAVRPFDITGRAMKGWVMVAEEGFSDQPALRRWIEQAKGFVRTLPPK